MHSFRPGVCSRGSGGGLRESVKYTRIVVPDSAPFRRTEFIACDVYPYPVMPGAEAGQYDLANRDSRIV